MGMVTDWEIADFRARSGIAVPEPEIQALWCNLQDLAYEVIKVASLEVSGVRDGDGYWHGAEVIGATLLVLERAVRRLRRYYDYGPTPQPAPTVDEDCEVLPF